MAQCVSLLVFLHGVLTLQMVSNSVAFPLLPLAGFLDLQRGTVTYCWVYRASGFPTLWRED